VSATGRQANVRDMHVLLGTAVALLLACAPQETPRPQAEGETPEARENRDDRELMGRLELPALSIDDLGRWREFVLPDATERAFEDLGWIPSFAAGLVAAERAGRPLFLWAMNGHPLGCT